MRFYKPLLFLLFFLVVNGSARSQILKNIKDRIKDKAEQKAEQKANSAIDNTIDSLTRKKSAGNRKNRRTKNPDVENGQPDDKGDAAEKNDQPPQDDKTAENNQEQQQDGPATAEGFITVNLSATRIFAGGVLTIKGESGMYENVNTVKISISGPATKDTKTVVLKDSTYTCVWYAGTKTGNFTVTAFSSDGKSTASQNFIVYPLSGIADMASENSIVTQEAYDQLKKNVDIAKPSLSTKDAADLDKKLSNAKEKIDLLQKVYADINTAGKNLSAAAKKGAGISDNMSGNLSALNNQLQEDAGRMKKTMELGKHEPYDNTICEYLVMVNEAAAAFSTFTNILPGTMVGILKDIALDKGVPTATGNAINDNISNPGTQEGAKESAQLFASAAFDGEGLVSKMGIAGFVGDMVQIITNVLLKQYCGVMTGTVLENYKVEYRNQSGQNWWTYGYTTKAVITLRYPKEQGNGKLVKMKGTIEGNATHFDFTEDITKEDDFKREAKNRVAVLPLVVKRPLSLDFPTVEADKLGFGAIARAIVTPAYFNIRCDAEYDRDAGTIRLFLNEPLIDFSAMVENKVLFVTPIPLPLFRVQSFPIEKVKKTMNAVVRRSKGYKVQKSPQGNLSFTDKDQFHIGNAASDIEQTVDLTIKVKQQ